MPSDELTETLLRIERRGWDSLCDGTGGDVYGRLMTEDAVMVLAHGVVLDRDGVVASLADAPAWRTYRIDDVRLVPCGSGAVALVYRGSAYREADQPAFVGLMTSVYQRVDGDWRLAVYQQTPVPADS